jgi:hypothetical protein
LLANLRPLLEIVLRSCRKQPTTAFMVVDFQKEIETKHSPNTSPKLWMQPPYLEHSFSYEQLSYWLIESTFFEP